MEISVDAGATWERARLRESGGALGWTRWEYAWRPERSGEYEILARATDSTGATQPSVTPRNTLGYQFGASIRHPVTVS